MTFIPFPSGASTVVNFAFGTFNFSNVFHWTKFGFTSEDLDQLASVVDQYWGGAMLAHFHVDTHYLNTTAYDLQTITGPISVVATSAGTGTQNDDALPLNSAMVVTLRTAARGRSARGRVYVGGLTESVFEDGGYTLAIEAAIQYALVSMKTVAATNGWTLCVASRQENKVVRSAIIGRPVTEIYIRRHNPGSRRKRVRRG